MHADHRNQNGSALVVVLVASLLMAGAAYAFVLAVVGESAAERSRTERAKATYVAEAGTADAVANLVPTMDPDVPATLGTEEDPVPFAGGAYHVTAVAEPDETFTVVSRATYGSAQVAIETRWGRAFHPLRDHAIYSGNRTVAANNLALGGTGTQRDIVNGKVHVNGNLALNGASAINGDAAATGTITGNPVNGEAKPGAATIAPPDLKVMKYDEIADFKVDATTVFDSRGRLPAGDPRHIFVKEFRDDLAKTTGFKFNNTNYFLGDPWESSDIDQISVSAAGNEKIYFIDGNLWIEPQGQTSRIVDSPADGTRITVIVRGNIYFSDDLLYDNAAKDALLFIALTDGESYRDGNGNNQYDPGEAILHDDGDGLYEGPVEGSGNVFFGDPNGGPLGHVHGYMYADNYFMDHVLDGTSRDPLPFDVTGFMSAGEQVQIRRDFNGRHARMRVNFDPRVVNGDISLPGFPEREAYGDFSLLSWRLVTP
jgi:hypothetical protein